MVVATLQANVIRAGHATGVTLVELVITMAVAAVLVAAAIPSYTSFIATQRVKTSSYELYGSLLYARSEALKRNAQVFVIRNGAGTWANGWIVSSLSTRTYTDCTDGAMEADCLKVQAPITTVAIAGGTAQVVYGGNGRTTVQGIGYTLCDTHDGADTTPRSIAIDLTGRPNISLTGTCT